ncbi:MAG TPA: glycosyltransferase [bacterium]|nr:glycosyltransferase [bacterium]
METWQKEYRICYFGAFPKGYARNRVIELGLKRFGMKVDFRVAPNRSLLGRSLMLSRGFARSFSGYDIILVGEGRHADVPLARMLGGITGATVILDAFISHYDSWVEDRGYFLPGSRQARAMRVADEWGVRLARAALMDTVAHAEFYSGYYGIPIDKFTCVRVGADDTVFRPRKKKRGGGDFTVLFYGSYLPLHGAETIVRAAGLLSGEKDIRFRMIGDGQELDQCRRSADDCGAEVEFIKPVTIENIAVELGECDVALGIFGTGGKASRVIPNKVYQALASARPVITADTPASRELLADGKDSILVPPGDAGALADSIMKIKNDGALADRISKGGFGLFDSSLRPEKVVLPLLELIDGLRNG